MTQPSYRELEEPRMLDRREWVVNLLAVWEAGRTCSAGRGGSVLVAKTGEANRDTSWVPSGVSLVLASEI